jgi:CO/xanthine dehydrogenase FAD-binding subunit
MGMPSSSGHDAIFRGRARPLIAEHASLIANCVETVADPQVRHRGTFGGACAHADPASDIPAPVLALDAEFVIAGLGGAAHGSSNRLLPRSLHDRRWR